MDGHVALTQSQMGLYLECMERRGELCYNLPYLYVFDLSLDKDRLNMTRDSPVSYATSFYSPSVLIKQQQSS